MDDQPIQSEVILGVDTHLDTHVGAVISETGNLLGTLAVSTDSAGYLKLLTWAKSLGRLRRAGVEGTGTYGAGLARVLHDHEIGVLEAIAPIGPAVDFKASLIQPMLKALHAQFWPEVRQPFRRRSREQPRRCARSRSPGAAPSRPRRRLSIKCGPCS